MFGLDTSRCCSGPTVEQPLPSNASRPTANMPRRSFVQARSPGFSRLDVRPPNGGTPCKSRLMGKRPIALLLLPLEAAFEGQLCDARFVEFAQAYLHHAAVLLEGRVSQREFQTLFLGEVQRDAGILRGVRGREETGVLAVLHVLAVGLEHARIGTRLREDLAEHRQVQLERRAQAETFG